MDQNKQQVDFGGCLAWAVENGAFALGMALMFSKTVDLMTAFAPRTIFGYTGIETYYGLAVGILIEGALFVMKLTLPRAKNPVDWLWNVLVVIAPFLISALAQVFDSFLVRDTLSQQPASMQLFITWFVPSIPTMIMALLIGKSIFSSIPAEMMPSRMSSMASAAPKPFSIPGFLRPKETIVPPDVAPANPTPGAPEGKKRPPLLGHTWREGHKRG